ncbi:MAG: biotin/lipoyl-containing protein [Litorilinea sp.]
MKYFSRIGDHEFEIRIEGEQIFIDDEEVNIDLEQGGAQELYSLLFNGKSYELIIESERFNYGVTLRGEHFQIQVEDERTRRLNAGRKAPSLPEGDLPVKAPIPGLVVKILAEVGTPVEDGQPLLLLEAMKMENEIRAPRAGVVKKVEVVAGQRVEQNALLIVLE